MVAFALILLAANPEPVRLVAPPLTAVGIDPSTARGWWDQLGRELTRRGLQIEGAGPADGTLTCEFSAVDDRRVLVHFKVTAADGRQLASASLTAGKEEDVADTIEVLAREVVTQLRPRFEAGRIPEELGKLKRTHAIAPGLAAGVLGALGGWALSPEQGDHTLGWALVGIGAAALALAIVILIFGDPP